MLAFTQVKRILLDPYPRPPRSWHHDQCSMWSRSRKGARYVVYGIRYSWVLEAIGFQMGSGSSLQVPAAGVFGSARPLHYDVHRNLLMVIAVSNLTARLHMDRHEA